MHLREGMIKVALVGGLPPGAPVPRARLAGWSFWSGPLGVFPNAELVIDES